MRLAVVVDHAEIGKDAGAIQKLHGEDALRAQIPENFGDALGRWFHRVVTEQLGVGAFAAIIELVESPGGKLSHGVAHEIQAADAEEQDEPHAHPQQQVVTLENGANTRALHFHRSRCAVLQRCAVYLADGGRPDGLVIEALVQIARRGAQELHKDALHLLRWKRWNPVEQRQQGVAIFAGQGIDLKRENLAELDEASAQLIEKFLQELWALWRPSA